MECNTDTVPITVGETKSNCLICKSEVLPPPAGRKIEYRSKLNVLFELLHLPFPSSVRFDKRSDKTGDTDKDIIEASFCDSCCTILVDVAQVINQIQSLQDKLKQTKGYVESLIYSSSCCTSDSQVDSLRQLVETAINAAKSEPEPRRSKRLTALTKSSVKRRKRGRSQIQSRTKPEPDLPLPKLKELSVNLVRLTEAEIQKSSNGLHAASSSDIDVDPIFDPDSEWCPPESPDSCSDDLEKAEQHDSASDSSGDGENYLSMEETQEGTPIIESCLVSTSSESNAKLTNCKRKGKLGTSKGSKAKKRLKSEKIRFKCPECDATFPTLIQQLAHTRANHEVPIELVLPYQCAQCRRRFNSETSLQTHLQKQQQGHQDGQCTQEPLPEYLSYLTGHGVRKFKCNICNTPFYSRLAVEDHYSVHTKEEHLVCDVCGTRFKTRNGLHRHKLRYHFDGKLETHPLKCSHEGCDKIFSGSYHLMLHEKKHRGEYEFLCTKCDFKTVTIAILNRHEKKHSTSETGETDYKCEQCGKYFSENSTLVAHKLQFHTKPEDRPFPCGYCTKAFSTKFKFKRHESIHTGQLAEECKICGRKFAVPDYLKTHMKNVHKGQLASTSAGGTTSAISVSQQQGQGQMQQEEIIVVRNVSEVSTEVAEDSTFVVV